MLARLLLLLLLLIIVVMILTVRILVWLRGKSRPVARDAIT